MPAKSFTVFVLTGCTLTHLRNGFVSHIGHFPCELATRMFQFFQSWSLHKALLFSVVIRRFSVWPKASRTVARTFNEYRYYNN